jgi:hypothetical protein
VGRGEERRGGEGRGERERRGGEGRGEQKTWRDDEGNLSKAHCRHIQNDHSEIPLCY